jgi:hypothetical protein
MSDPFQDREKGFERKFEHDQELDFKVRAHRDRLFGEWVAGRLGFGGAAADRYARGLVSTAFEPAGDPGMLAQVRADLSAANIPTTEGEILREFRRAEIKARADVMGPQR